MYHISISHGNLQNNLHNPAASQGPATCESNNLPTLQQFSDSIPDVPRGLADLKDNSHIAGQTVLLRSDSGRTIVTTKADMDLLAQRRDNAMLRYKEKKKTRRCLLLLIISPLTFPGLPLPASDELSGLSAGTTSM